MNNYTFTYADISNLTEEQQKRERSIRDGVLSVQCLSTKQLQKKKPRFVVFLNTKVFDKNSADGGQTVTAPVTTIPLGDGRYKVCDGWGQLSNGIIELLK